MAAEVSRADGVEQPVHLRAARRADDGRVALTCGPPGLPNDVLVARCIAGEFGAWNELITRYERLVYAIPLREGLSPDDAAEVSQATFESLIESLHRIRDPERLGYWLMTVARRLSWRRRTASRVEVSLGTDLPEPPVDTADGTWELTADIYDAILQLGDPCRTLIFELFFDPAEPSYDEIARMLGMAVGSIGPLRGRCLDRLRSLLEIGAA